MWQIVCSPNDHNNTSSPSRSSRTSPLSQQEAESTSLPHLGFVTVSRLIEYGKSDAMGFPMFKLKEGIPFLPGSLSGDAPHENPASMM